MAEKEYAKTPVNTVNRLRPRATYNYRTIHSIIDSAPVLHVSFNPLPSAPDPFPVILPMIGCTGSFTDQGSDAATSAQDLYLHGYVSSRLMKLPTNPGTPAPGTPVCVAATLLDGLVLALTPNHHSCNYRSAVVYGYAHLVTDEAEKLYAMEKVTNNMLPNRWANSRLPPTKAEMTSTAVLRLSIDSASAKVRGGEPDEDRADLKNEEMRERVWTGVVPAWLQWGEPVAAEGNRVPQVPSYLEQWRQGENERGRDYAVEAVSRPKK